jgi:branched-chain amino acid transport system permease protein
MSALQRFSLFSRGQLVVLGLLAMVPLVDLFVPGVQLAAPMRNVIVFAILALGLNIVVGWTGLLHLGIAAFMAIGAYAFGILTCEIYPFQVGFWWGVILAGLIGAFAGWLLGAPTLRLRGDYLAIVTLGFGEIVQDALKNLEIITKGTQGINPLPPPTVFGAELGSRGQYWLLLAFVVVVFAGARSLERSRIGRAWLSIREDELASRAMGIRPDHAKMLAFATCASLAALAGALTASRLASSGEPSNYDFQVSVLALCIVIVGGIGSVRGVLLGAIVMVGMNSIVLVKLTEMIGNTDAAGASRLAETHGMERVWVFITTWAQNVLLSPTNWKFLLFGLALVLMMMFRPQGILPPRAEHEAPPEDEGTGPAPAKGAAP